MSDFAKLALAATVLLVASYFFAAQVPDTPTGIGLWFILMTIFSMVGGLIATVGAIFHLIDL